MQRIALMLIGGVLAILSTRAVAFQESKEGAADQPAAAQPAAPATQPPLDLSDTGTSVGSAPAGVEVRIPGLGNAAGQVSNGVSSAVPSTTVANIQTNVALAADNAWQVFLVGALVLAVSSFAGYLGRKNREKAVELQATHDLDSATTY